MTQIANLTKKRAPRIFWKKIAGGILGKKYDLSVVLAGNSLMEKLNIRYRKQNKPASVLSFPISAEEGEIFINLGQKRYLPLFLFIHALLHLKGFEHGAKMKVQEQKALKKYGKKYHSRT